MSLTNEQRETLREDERHIVESLGHAGANRHGGYHGKPVEHGVNLLAARLCEAREELARVSEVCEDCEYTRRDGCGPAVVAEWERRHGAAVARAEAAERDAANRVAAAEHEVEQHADDLCAGRKAAERELAEERKLHSCTSAELAWCMNDGRKEQARAERAIKDWKVEETMWKEHEAELIQEKEAAERAWARARTERDVEAALRSSAEKKLEDRDRTMRGWQERAAEIVALSSSSHIHVSTVPSGKALIGPSRISRRKAHDNAAKLARDIAASKQEPDK